MFFPLHIFRIQFGAWQKFKFWFSFQNYFHFDRKFLGHKSQGAKCHFWFRKCLQIKEMPQLANLLCLTFYIRWRETEIMFCENLGMTKSWENPWLTSFAKLTVWSVLIIQQSLQYWKPIFTYRLRSHDNAVIFNIIEGLPKKLKVIFCKLGNLVWIWIWCVCRRLIFASWAGQHKPVNIEWSKWTEQKQLQQKRIQVNFQICTKVKKLLLFQIWWFGLNINLFFCFR